MAWRQIPTSTRSLPFTNPSSALGFFRFFSEAAASPYLGSEGVDVGLCNRGFGKAFKYHDGWSQSWGGDALNDNV
ncbi:hypothetical protein Tsubulata_005074 [Turnera subulata]|uniref:Uncharacterized protein n=1 Tax=Turnera subulata TaxID=218843 RepID=A0A9Q0FM37_9ROSI|nr:hypothetical protein Tsubulata_005074 [Turnera subulata]